MTDKSRITGSIRPTRDDSRFGYEAWCELVGRRPEFRRPPARQARNPFSGEPVTIRPRKDAAEVIVGGQSIGNVYWSMSEEPLVNVDVDAAALPLVREWTNDLGGVFHEEP